MVRKDKNKINKYLACLLVFSFLFCFFTTGHSQATSIWTPTSASVLKRTDTSIPFSKGKTYLLNESSIAAKLDPASREDTREFYLKLPYPNGTQKTFLLTEASILPEQLAKQFPTVRSFKGYGVEDPTAYTRLSWTAHGLQGIILTAKEGTIYLDPIDKTDLSTYISYYKKDAPKDPFACHVEDMAKREIGDVSTTRSAGDCTLRTYRLAVTCTGEYTQYHGGSIADAVAAINTTITRINAVFETELAITFRLVDNLTDIIFINPNTDPFDAVSSQGGFNEFRLLDQTSSTINTLIGVDNFDLGHLFFTGGGGSAALGSVCDNQFKAEGISGLPNPEGVQFDIDFVAHELGHQFGADHTFSGQSGACFRQGVNHASVEPGSGTTIMSYAGICAEENVEMNVGAYFHARSLEQISNFIQGSGNSCAEVTDLSKEPPVANAGNNYFIPRGTPFVLTGETVTSNSNTISYNWEQMDNGITTQPPLSTAASGPLFRSYPPSTSPQRYFPNLADLSANRSYDWEVLPVVERPLNFRMTVRDNDPNSGCTAEDDVRLQVDGDAGPFEVVENGFDTWTVGERTTIEWMVAGTDNSPINVSSVDIYLSTDGGLSFPHLIIENLPNSGSAQFFVPNFPGTTTRIMVKGHDHIFFDINDENFEIEAILNDIVIQIPETTQSVCNNQAAVYPIEVGISGSVTGVVAMSTNGLPAIVNASFTNPTFRPPGNTTLTLTNLDNLPTGTYDFEVVIETDRDMQIRELELAIIDATNTVVTLESPEDNAIGQSILPTFEWEALSGIDNYTFQLSSSPNFDALIIEQVVSNNSIAFENPLELLTRYYWRVIPASECASNDQTVFTFSTVAAFCKTYQSEDVPLSISPVGNGSVISTIEVPDEGFLIDINVRDVEIEHTWIQDISLGLVSPTETGIFLTEEICESGQSDLFLSFDSDAPGSYLDISCPPTTGETFKGLESLDFFIGEPINGPWKLAVLDPYDMDGGSLINWSLEICYLDLQAKPALSFFIEKEDETCFGSKDGQVTAFPIDGNGDYAFEWSNGANTSTIQNLSPGTYTVTISDGDTSLVQTVDILAAFPIDVNFSNSVMTCPNTKTGFISASGNLTDLTFEWNTGERGPAIMELESGTYFVTINNSRGCSQIKEFNIAEDLPIQATLSTRNATCQGGNDGLIEIQVIDDRFLQYQWSDGSNLSFLDELTPGDYSVTITTEGNCSEVFSASISEPLLPFMVSSTIQKTGCFGDTSSVALHIEGGFPPYEITCDNPLGNCTNFLDGNYQIVITDSMGCSVTEEISLISPNEITLQVLPINPSTINGQDGSIQTSISGGSGPFTYQWSTGNTTENISDVGAGTYSVTVADALGCTKTTSILIEEGACYNVGIEFSFEHPNCLGEGLGAIQAVPANGEGPFAYVWNTGDTIAQLDNLSPGEYEVTITDALGCFGFNSQQLIPESDIVINLVENVSFSCLTSSFGSLEIIASGGVGEVNFLWSNGKEGTTIDSLEASIYSVTVTDEVGCTNSASYQVGNSDALIKPVFIDQLELYLDTSGIIELEQAMLLLNEVDSCSVNAIQFSKLSYDCSNVGSTELIVTTQFSDATSELTTIPVRVIDTLAPVFTCPTDIEIEHCFEDMAVVYDLSVSDNCGTPELQKIRGFDSGSSFPAGTTRVTFEATDVSGNGAICDFAVTLGEGSNIVIDYVIPSGVIVESTDDPLLISAILICAEDDFSSVIKPRGGIPPYEIEVIPSLAETNPFYLIEVRDSNNCSTRETVDISIFSTPMLNQEVIAEIKDETSNQKDGSIFIEPLEGESIVKYEWFFQDSLLATSNSVEGLSAGEYQLILTDLIGCTYEFNFTVGVLVSTKELEALQKQLLIAPNPTDGIFSITTTLTNSSIQLIELFSLDGRKLPISVVAQPYQKEWVIDLHNFSSGLYLVKIHTLEGVILKRVALL